MTVTLLERQADLDDLLLRCRAENAKLAFSEAVACFRAGAYRACIVSTRTAVVFDYVGKLRELELSGNGDADLFAELFGALLDQAIRFDGPTEKSIVWPVVGAGPDLHRIRKLAARRAHQISQLILIRSTG